MNAVMLAVFVAYMCIVPAIGFGAAVLVSTFSRSGSRPVERMPRGESV